MNEAERAFHQIQNTTGRRYPALMKLIVAHADAEVVRDLYALARDLATVIQQSVRKGARELWRAF